MIELPSWLPRTYRRVYRVVPDRYAGWEVQHREWWWPFWLQARTREQGCNTHKTVEVATSWAQRHARRELPGQQRPPSRVRYLGPLT